MQRILIIGATSAIAEATARRFAQEGAALYLLARDQERLSGLSSDLKIRGAASVAYARFDADDNLIHRNTLDQAMQHLGSIDVALISYGTLGDQKACEQSIELALRELNTNFQSVIVLLTHLANQLELQGHGTIAVISSVAGDRGRQSNYIYGTAKGAVAIFLQGLRNRLHKKNVHVVTIKPGFVDTPMTAAFRKGILWSAPQVVADGIVRAIAKKKDVVYLPFWWGGIMKLIGLIPESWFKTLKL